MYTRIVQRQLTAECKYYAKLTVNRELTLKVRFCFSKWSQIATPKKLKIWPYITLLLRSQIHERIISLRFLGILLRVLSSDCSALACWKAGPRTLIVCGCDHSGQEPSRNQEGTEYGIELPIAHETSILEDGINFFILNICPLSLSKFVTYKFLYRRNRFLRGINSMEELIPPDVSMPRNRLPVLEF